jgi:hypothetical protein
MIADRLRASIKYDAINGDSFERSVCGKQMGDAAMGIEAALLAMRGARDMLNESAKMHRLRKDEGHADMCEVHKKQLEIAINFLERS